MRAKILFLAALVASVITANVEARLVACVGDSITYGAGIADRTNNSYPAQLQRILQQYDPAWEVRNFGVSGATLLRRGDKPYIQETAYGSTRASNPDVVVIKLGTNDSKPQNWQYKDDFVSDYGNMIDVFRALPSRPEVWICKPVPAFRVNFAIRPEVTRAEILPLIDQIASEKQVPVIDLYTALLDAESQFPDAIHPNAEGAGLIAQAIAPFLLGVRILPDFNADGILNLLDFSRLAVLWRQSDSSLDVAPPPDGDGMIGYRDLAGLATFWLTYPGLVAHWRLDETDGQIAADRLGRFDGTLQNDPIWRPTDGRIHGALGLDGLNDYVSTGNVLNPADGPFTVFIWVKGGRPGQAILSQPGQSGALWLGTDASTGAVMTSLTDGARLTTPLVSQTVVTDGLWHRVRLVWDGSQRCLYVDGKEATADTRKLGALRFSSAGFYIGAGRALETEAFWSGLIDDIRFYNRAVKP